MIKTLIVISVPVLSFALAMPVPARQQLKAEFAADRVIVTLPLKGGDKLRFYTDTGGGVTLLYPAATRRLMLRTGPVAGPAARDFPPAFQQLVDPLPLTGGPPPPPLPAYSAPDFLVAIGGPSEADGFLGNGWFAGRIWTWDYPDRTLTLEDDSWAPRACATVLPVTFRAPVPGKPSPSFPRLVVDLAGEPTSMLLDTGAETLLTPQALARIGGGPALRATSMIATSRFQAWHAVHPDWPVIEKAQAKTGARMIRVPDVVIAGLHVGPIWFTERPDANFHGMMSSSMDAQVEGAIGGNAFHSLRMTIDYRAGRAAFEQK